MLFFRTIFALFRGVSCFPGLMDRHPLRVLFHLLLFSLTLSCFITVARIWQWSGHARYLTENLGAYFGGINVTERGVVPLKNGKKTASFILTPLIRFTYLPADLILTAAETISADQPIQVFWAPRGFVMTMRVQSEQNSYMLFHLPIPGINTFALVPQDTASYRKMSADEVVKYLSDAYSMKNSGRIWVRETIQPEGVLEFIRTCAVVSLLIMSNLFLLGLSLATVVIFSLIQYFWRGPGYSSLKYRNIFVIMLYSTFPALAAGALYLAFSLPFFSYETVFFIVFFVYHLMAFHAVFRHLNPPRPEVPKNDGDDQDFF